MRQARDCSMLPLNLASPTEVFILISVYNVLTDPGMALFVDPWQMHINGSLALMACSPYYASFKDATSALFLQRFPAAGKREGANGDTSLPQTWNKNTGKMGKSSRDYAVADDGFFSYRPLR